VATAPNVACPHQAPAAGADAPEPTGMLAAMFNVGGGEVLVIALIALIVLGPNRLPGAARQAGKVLADLRRISQGFQNEVRTAFEEAGREEAPESPDPLASSPQLDEAISAVSAHTPAPASAAERASKQAPTKKVAKKAAATKKAPTKKAPTKKAATNKAAATKKAAPVSPGARRRRPS
jgi:sec-independent protein translocase protein TatB